ncbi:MAG: hypothetical protein KAQ99_01240, partial [Candidatus Aureabacteria bacterium]|nr:hypothetical protein [Candidatus Auribacterota bacterium]
MINDKIRIKILSIFALSAILVSLFIVQDAQAALQVKQVLRGAASFAVEEDTQVISIGATVDTSKSIIIISPSAGTASAADTNCAPGEAYFGAQFDDSSNIMITRGVAHMSGSTATVGWQVIEFADGVTVTEGTTSLNELTKLVTLSTNLTESKSLVILTGKTVSKFFNLGNAAGRAYCFRNDETWEITSEITDYGNETTPASVTFTRNDKLLDNSAAISVTVYYQIVEFNSDVNVQHDTVTIADASSSNYSTLGTTVDDTKSVLFFTTRAPASTSGLGVEQDYRVSGDITDSGTRATFTRVGTSGAVNIAWYVLTFSDATTVKKGSLSGTTAALTSSPAWSPAVDTTRAFSVISSSGASGAGTTGLDDTNYRHNITTTNITATREGGSSISSTVPYFVVEMPIVKLAAPNGGQVWRVGQTEEITWKSVASVAGDTNASVRITTTNSTNISEYVDLQTGVTMGNESYNWTIPADMSGTNLIGANARIGIIDNNLSADNYDISDAVFEIKGDLNLTYPLGGGGQNFTIGNEVQVDWTASGDLSTDNLTLWVWNNGNSSWDAINSTITGTNNTSDSYNWTISDTDPTGTNVKVKISWNADAGNVTDQSDDFFAITPGIEITEPTITTEWYTQDNGTINWTKSGTWDSDEVELYYKNVSSGSWVAIATDANASNLTYEWENIPVAAVSYPSKTQIQIKTVDDPSVQVTDESGLFYIKPYVQMDYPSAGGIIWNVTETRQINWTLYGTMDKAAIWYNNSSGWNLLTPGGGEGISAS